MKKIIIPISTLFVAGISYAQTTPSLSTNENYVYSKTYLHYPKPTDTDQTIKSSETVQYLDGLGRPKQVINIKASPLGRDVVSHIVYDQYGRQALDYLPVPQGGTGNGAIVGNPLTNATQTDIYGSEIIFAKKEFDSSPLNRVLEQKQVGTVWSSKPVKFEYDANADGEVKKYTATFNYSNFQSLISVSGHYAINQLSKSTITDEDGNKTIEFKNGLGQTLLVRKMIDLTNSADTYYVYNDYNQLAYVIPPLAVAANAVDTTTLNNLCYQYKYDARNRLIEKKLPGKGWEFMLYDTQDRLVATKDANLDAAGQWLFTKYDQFGRVAFTGISTGGSRADEQASVETNGKNNMLRTDYVGFSREGMDVYYSGRTYPADSKYVKILSVNYYDTYAPYSFNPAFPADVISDNSTTNNKSTKSLPVMSFVKNVEDDNWTKNYTWYDGKGRPVAGHSINHLGGYTKTESDIDISGTPSRVVTRHKRVSTDAEKVITENFSYDPQNRLKVHKHKIDNNIEEILTQNDYNELSQLRSKKVGGKIAGSGLQKVDYTYNIRGWMTQINDPANLGGDLFGYKIRYNQVEGLETPDTSDPTLKVLPKYNGNIAEVDWKTGVTENESLKRYGYVYDGMNRLSAGFYQNANNPSLREYYEKVTYDINGNINKMKRTAQRMGGTALLIDDLTYQYENSGASNRLQKISDNVTLTKGYPYKAVPTDIGYDANGNTTSFQDKGISSIQYNYLNLPKQITQNSEVTSYTYRADGVKVKKLFNGLETDYLDGFQYKFTQAWEDPNGTMMNDEMKLRIIPTAEGYFDALRNAYFYNYTDHLGNVRVSYSDRDENGEVTGDIVVNNCVDTPDGQMCNNYIISGEAEGVTNYYPFGMMHTVEYNTFDNAYLYKYNGKELQETGMYDYGARFYMPDIGRWGVVDPLAEKYRRHTPYAYAVNNPIYFIDPDGMQIDPANQKEWDRLKGSVTKTRDALQGDVDKINQKAKDKGWDSKTLASKMGDKQDRLNSVNQSLTNMSTLESSDQMYGLNKMEGTEGITNYDKNTDKINIGYVSDGNFVHEMTHGAQFESGDIAFFESGGSAGQDLDDETAAYKAQAAFDPSSVGGMSINSINNNWLTTLRDSSGQQVYGVGGSAKSGLFGVTINSTVGQLIRAYPAAKEDLKKYDQSIKLRNFQGIKYKK